jgi:hypothetical protein
MGALISPAPLSVAGYLNSALAVAGGLQARIVLPAATLLRPCCPARGAGESDKEIEVGYAAQLIGWANDILRPDRLSTRTSGHRG